ncbi:MAG: DNA ligase (NAD(+)) LigA [Spirochaetes bacterium GWF1_41_5]|nr:MAG: DNA ligase (NAD(+)) LigA [Spirochaetes bacterium GWF1_41_5]
MKDAIQKEISDLTRRITAAEKAYYREARPIISDTEFDRLFDRLKKLEEENPELRNVNSPTMRAGSDLVSDFPEKPHSLPVLSLDKCYNSDELTEWIKKLEEKNHGLEFTMEPKIDGAGIVLYYDNGSLQYALTRGSGYTGNDVTDNIRTIKSIPLQIGYKKKIAVRGEIFIKTEAFSNFNKKFDGAWANPRNLAAGALRRQKSTETAGYPLECLVYEGFTQDTPETHTEIIKLLYDEGFPVNSHFVLFSDNMKTPLPVPSARLLKFSEIKNSLEMFRAIRGKLPYEIDGLVIKLNNIAEREKLGYTQHHPRWAIAYKFESPLAETQLRAIEIQIGRGGRITPVAVLDPVKLSGSVISRATLHNQDYIDSLEVNTGDRVSLSKRGDVIPAVEEVTEKGSNSGAYQLPETCPACHSILIKDGAHLFCPSDKCSARELAALKYFVAKDQMNIDTLGGKTVEYLYQKGFIKNPADIYYFNYRQLENHEGFGEKKIENIIKAVEESKKRPFTQVLASLGIKDIGHKAAQLLAEKFTSIDEIISLAEQKKMEILTDIDGIGETIADSVIKFFSDPAALELIGRLKNAGLIFISGTRKQEGKFKGTTWVITGTFEKFRPRDLAAELIRSLGGEITSSVSSRTSYLLCGKDPGSKLKKAETLKVKIINEADFIRLTTQSRKNQDSGSNDS